MAWKAVDRYWEPREEEPKKSPVQQLGRESMMSKRQNNCFGGSKMNSHIENNFIRWKG
jgi:hypothetical protein